MTKNHISSNLASYFNVFEQSLSKPQFSHFKSWNLGILHGNAQGSDISRQFSDKSETSVTRFLSQSSWDHHELNNERIDYAKNVLAQEYQRYTPFIIDDTSIEKYGKKLPGIDYQYSHSVGGVIWGQTLVTSHMTVAGNDIPLFVDLYQKNSDRSKIDLARAQIKKFSLINLPETTTPVVVTDTWYASKDLINDCVNQDFVLVSQLKRNRKMKPQQTGKWMKIMDIATKLKRSALRRVKVKGTQFRYAQIQGTTWGLKDHQCKILIVQQFLPGKRKWSKFTFLLSTEASMGAWTLLWIYRSRWTIENFYKFGKEQMGMAESRVLKELALLRFILLLFSSYTYLSLIRCKTSILYRSSSSYYKSQRRTISDCRTQLISWVYIQGQEGRPLEEILLELSLAEISA